jgi:hypothetical protein
MGISQRWHVLVLDGKCGQLANDRGKLGEDQVESRFDKQQVGIV